MLKKMLYKGKNSKNIKVSPLKYLSVSLLHLTNYVLGMHYSIITPKNNAHTIEIIASLSLLSL